MLSCSQLLQGKTSFSFTHQISLKKKNPINYTSLLKVESQLVQRNAELPNILLILLGYSQHNWSMIAKWTKAVIKTP